MIFKKLVSIRYHQNLSKVFKNSQNYYTERSGYIIKLYIDNYCGCGEASPLPFFSNESIKHVEWAIEELKVCLLSNQKYNAQELFALFEVFAKDCPSLNFALDIALYDILSKKNNLSLAKYLNKKAINKINFSLIDFDKIKKKSSMKIKLGVDSLDKELKKIKNIYKRHPDLFLRIDFNRLCNLKDAIFICNELKECNIEYIEEPLKSPLEKDYIRLINAVKLPVALDETVIEGKYKKLIDLNLIDYIILKPSLFGSIKNIIKLNDYLYKNKVQLILSSSLQTKIGNMAEINLASSLMLCLHHGLNNYAFFSNEYDVPYDKNECSFDLKGIKGLGACWDD